jgi:hypothetical protein
MNATLPPAATPGPLQRYAATTPGRYRLLAGLCALSLLVTVIATTASERSLSRSTGRVRNESGPVLIATQQVFSSLAEADAAATAEYLAGSGDGRDQRRLYEDALDRAARQIDVIASRIGDQADAHAALQDLLSAIARYSGAIETARATKAAGASGADASLAAALAISSSQITPAVSTLLIVTQQRITDDSHTTTYTLVGLLAVLALVFTQLVITRRTRRLVNLPLAAATLLVLVATVWLYVAAQRQQDDVGAARRVGLDSIGLTGTIQATAYRTKSAESLALIGTAGNADQFATADKNAAALLDTKVSDELVGQARSGQALSAKGLLVDASRSADTDREHASVAEILVRWQRYRDTSATIRSTTATSGGVAAARTIATNQGNSTFNGFNLSVESFLADNRTQFVAKLDAASDRLRGLRLAMIILPLLAAALALWGVQLRWNEYR